MVNWIRTQEELERFVASLEGCHTLALDSESDSLHHYVEKVCLVQVATDRGGACLIDPLALKGLDALSPTIADPKVLKVFHGADYDVTTMKRDFAFHFEGLFDTMIAARFIGATEFGLQALLRAELGVELSKTSQKDDWSRRPLTPTQEAYAVADVAHLHILQARLAARLRDLGRLAWVLEECAAVAALEPARRRHDPDSYQKIKGARALSRRSLAVLREMAAWREARAASSDIPPFKILSSETLLAIAEALPRNREDVAKIRGLSKALRADPAPVLDAVGRALALPEAQLPVIPRGERPKVSDAVRKRIARLKEWRAVEATRLGLDVSLILPQRLMDLVIERAPKDVGELQEVEGIRRWRVEALGSGMLHALLSSGARPGDT